MTKPKPPRVLNYDPEFGYIVAGTHDVELATVLLRKHMEREGDDGLDWLDRYGAPAQVWGRKAVQPPGSEYKWMWMHTKPGARGAFRAVEWYA